MSRKSKRRKHKKQQKGKPTQPQQTAPPPLPPASATFPTGGGGGGNWDSWKLPKKVGKVLAVLLSLLAVIVVLPRLSASATPPLDLGNQLASSRFTVTNDGNLQITEVMSACFLWSVKEGSFNATSSLARVVVPPENRLRPAESLTVPCTTENMIGTAPPFRLALKKADLAIVVYYRVWPLTFYRDHKLFRFVARVGQDGAVVWDKQPCTRRNATGLR